VQTYAAKTKVKITSLARVAPDTKFLILINETDADAKVEYRIE
jgi:hypothetical protein